MSHPLQADITGLSDQELENQISVLTKKYFQALRFVPGAANQVAMLLEGYKWEQQRRAIAKSLRPKDNDTDFGSLINID